MVAGALVVSTLVAEVAHLKMAAGADPVALRSQNLPGSEEANEELIARYRKRSRLYESRCGSVQPGITPIYSPIGGGDLAEHLATSQLASGWHQKGPVASPGLLRFPHFASTLIEQRASELPRTRLLRAWVNTDSAARDIFRHVRPAVSPLANVRPIRRLAMDRDP